MKTLQALLPPLVICLLGLIATFLVTPWALLVVIIFALDAYGRYRDWTRLSQKPPSYFTTRVLDYYGQSMCGRSMIRAAYPEAGAYYNAKGYRAYHVFPDGTFSRNTPMLKPSFWRAVVFGNGSRM